MLEARFCEKILQPNYPKQRGAQATTSEPPSFHLVPEYTWFRLFFYRALLPKRTMLTFDFRQGYPDIFESNEQAVDAGPVPSRSR
jgi:hypothetical protein